MSTPCKVAGFDGTRSVVLLRFEHMPCVAVGEEWRVVTAEKCRWVDDSDGNYESACGSFFVFTCDGVKQNGFKFCPFCGKEIEE